MRNPRWMLGAMGAHLSYANVMATVAVFVALGGGAYAVTELPRNSVGTAQIRAHAVTGSRLARHSVGTTQLERNAVTLNRLSAGVRSLIADRADPGVAGPAGPQGQPGAQGTAGPIGATGTRSFQATGTDRGAYATGSTLVSVAVPSAGLYILYGSVTLANNGPDHVSGGCGLFNGARQLQAGNGVELDPGDSANFPLPGLDQVRDSTQPVTMLCQFSGTGPLAASAITLRAVRIEE